MGRLGAGALRQFFLQETAAPDPPPNQPPCTGLAAPGTAGAAAARASLSLRSAGRIRVWTRFIYPATNSASASPVHVETSCESPDSSGALPWVPTEVVCAHYTTCIVIKSTIYIAANLQCAARNPRRSYKLATGFFAQPRPQLSYERARVIERRHLLAVRSWRSLSRDPPPQARGEALSAFREDVSHS